MRVVNNDLRYEILKSLLEGTDPELGIIPKDSDRQNIQRLLNEFQMSPDFSERANAEVAEIRHYENEAEETTSASLFLDKVSYPLTIFAMVVVVLGFGHLLSNRPRIETNDTTTNSYLEK